MLWTAFDLSYQINNIYNLSSRFSVDKNQIKSDYFVWFSLGFVFRFGLGFVFGFGIRITYGHIPLGHGHITKNIKPLIKLKWYITKGFRKIFFDSNPVLGGGGTCPCKTMRTLTKHVHHCIFNTFFLHDHYFLRL